MGFAALTYPTGCPALRLPMNHFGSVPD